MLSWSITRATSGCAACASACSLWSRCCAGLHGPCTNPYMHVPTCEVHCTLACIDHSHLRERGPPAPLVCHASAEALTQSTCCCSNPCGPRRPAGHIAAALTIHCNPACGTLFWVLQAGQHGPAANTSLRLCLSHEHASNERVVFERLVIEDMRLLITFMMMIFICLKRSSVFYSVGLVCH